MFRSAFIATSLLIVPAGAAMGGMGPIDPPTRTLYSDTDTTRAFAGLNLVFGANGVTPEGVLGVIHGRTDKSNDVTGAKASLHFDLGNNFGLRSAKLTGLAGDRDVQGELGFGYSFGRQSFFGVAGANAEYLNIGGDIGFDGLFEGYVGVHTFDGFDARGKTTETMELGIGDEFLVTGE